MNQERQKPGRKKLPDDQKRKIVTAYLTDTEKAFIIKNFGSLTKAIKEFINSLNTTQIS